MIGLNCMFSVHRLARRFIWKLRLHGDINTSDQDLAHAREPNRFYVGKDFFAESSEVRFIDTTKRLTSPSKANQVACKETKQAPTLQHNSFCRTNALQGEAPHRMYKTDMTCTPENQAHHNISTIL
jgi:hypothetical protein